MIHASLVKQKLFLNAIFECENIEKILISMFKLSKGIECKFKEL